MPTQSPPQVYAFLDFVLNQGQRSLIKKRQTIQLSKKSLDILLVLVDAQGQVVEKDHLIAQVWPDQIVTDAALNKQVTRLKSTLSEFCDAPIIETVRGVGFRFQPTVQLIDEDHPSTGILKPAIGMALLLLLVWLLYVWLLPRFDQEPSPATQPLPETINLAIAPAANDRDWLDVGGVHFLSNQLRGYQSISTLNPEFAWFNQLDAEQLDIKLSQLPGVHYVLTIGHQQLADGYVAELQWRHEQSLVARHEIQAPTLGLLLAQIETWVIQQLNISTQLIENKKSLTPVVSDFVLESYLRAVAAADAGHYTAALPLLQNALHQDEGYVPAWQLMAEVEAELGQFEQSLAVIDAVINTQALPPHELNQLLTVKAKSLIYLNRLDEAQALIDQSLAQAERDQNVAAVMANLHNLALLSDYRGQLGVADLDTLNRLLTLTQNHRPSPNQLGTVLRNLGITHHLTGNIQQALAFLNQAADQFNITQDAEGLVGTYTALAKIQSQLAENDQALLTLDQAKPHLERLDGARTLAHYWMIRASSHYELGERSAAQACIDRLYQMSVDYATQQPRVKGLIIAVEMAISYQDHTDARHRVDELLDIVSQQPQAYPVDAPYAVALDLYSDIVSGQVASAKHKRQEYLSVYPELTDMLGEELQRIDALILAADGYTHQATERLQQLELAAIQESQVLTANYLAIETLNLLSEDDLETRLTIINRVKQRAHFPYPIEVFHAQTLFEQGQSIMAVAVMLKLKAQAKAFWSARDQLLLERWQLSDDQP